MWSMKFILHTLYSTRAFEDGPDRGFRNVGKTQSDAGEIPKRTYTIFMPVMIVLKRKIFGTLKTLWGMKFGISNTNYINETKCN
jgi:hypothetical protein